MEDSFSILFLLGTGFLIAATLLAPLYLSGSTIVAVIVILATFVTFRHVQLTRPRLGSKGQAFMGMQIASANTGGLPAVYFLYVLGSGGHTAEMCEMIKQKTRPEKNHHRRYVSTSGDDHASRAIMQLESIIKDAYIDGRSGTFDHYQVQRARKVHQPFYTAWLTSIWSALNIVGALTSGPYAACRSNTRLYKYPHVVITNGPGTGFVLCLVAHLLKIFYLVPQNRLKLVYIESWAHTQTLSLTGKLFRRTGIANLFCVQHMSLAEKLPGTVYVGLVIPPAERLKMALGMPLIWD